MYKKRSFLFSAFSVLTALALFSACKKSNEANTQLSVKLTDAPYNAQEVNVDIKEVRVNFAKDTSAWVSLNTNAKVYNLIKFQNGVDTVLATGSFPGGTVQEVRFILGNANSIKIDNIVYPLSVASGDETGLKIKVAKNLNATLDNIIIDFDADVSIIKTGSGSYKLKPVLRVK